MLRILFVDDDPVIAMLGVGMLKKLGHTAVQAGSGAKALEVLAGGDIDVLMTDYSMRGMNGLELASAAREVLPRLPILLITGHSDLPDADGEHFCILQKPYTRYDLEAAISSLLDEA